MGEDDLSAKQDRLSQMEKECGRLEKRLAQGQGQLEKIEDNIQKKEVQLRQIDRDEADARAALRLSLRDLNDQNELLLLGQEHAQYVHSLQAERLKEKDAPTLLEEALQQRGRQIEAVLDCLRQTEAARGRYDAALSGADQAETAAQEAERQVRDAQAREREERDELIEAFARRREQNTQLDIPQEIWLEIRQSLNTYSTPADWTPIRNQLDDCERKTASALQGEQLQAERGLSELEKEHRELEYRRRQIESQPEPIPPRRAQTEAARIQLMMRGVPCAPVYELLDFAPGLSRERQALLEAQLLDAGLLDALVVPDGRLSEIQELLAEYPDRFLVPGPAVADPIDSLIPDKAGRFPQEAAACLRSISRSDLNAETALLEDGRFRCGMIRGYSRAEGPAGFVGAAARAENRRRQLQALEEELTRLAADIQEARRKVDDCKVRLEQLRQERSQMPTAEELDQALMRLGRARNAFQQAEGEKKRCLDQEQKTKQAWAALEQESRSRSAGLPYEKTVEAYQEAREAANGYRDILAKVNRKRGDLISAISSGQATRDIIDNLRDQADDKKKDNDDTQESIFTQQAGIQELRDFLSRPENQARARRLAELDREIQVQDQENRDAEKQCIRLEGERNSADEIIRQRKQRLTEAEMDEQDLERYFAEDLDLGFVTLDRERGLEECARQAASRVQASDRGRTVAEMGEAISSNFQRYRGSLSNYHPEIKMWFGAPGKPAQLRQRYVIVLKKNGKELSLYGFIQSLQSDIDTTGNLLEDKDRDLFEDILTDTVSHTLRARIEESAQWTRNMTGLMAKLTTSMGLNFSLDWKEKKSEGTGELDTAQLVTFLNKDRALLTPEDSQRVSGHFRSKMKRAREEAHIQGIAVNYADLIRSVLDYRSWYEFHLFYQRGDSGKKELTDRVFNRFSGGEKAMSMYVPLFAAVSAQYLKGGDACPRLMALDEAFAGVDDQNISAMFELMEILEFDYIINSQVLWGCYACVTDLDIAEMYHPANAPVVTILHYHWNGAQRTLEDGEG